MTAASSPSHPLTAYQRAMYDAYGFRPSHKGTACPRSLARGGRCRSTWTDSCICTKYRYDPNYPDFLDHSARWIDHNGLVVMTSEPYSSALTRNPEKYSSFIEEMNSLKFSVVKGDVSPWLSANGYPDAPTTTNSETQVLIIRTLRPVLANPLASTRLS